MQQDSVGRGLSSSFLPLALLAGLACWLLAYRPWEVGTTDAGSQPGAQPPPGSALASPPADPGAGSLVQPAAATSARSESAREPGLVARASTEAPPGAVADAQGVSAGPDVMSMEDYARLSDAELEAEIARLHTEVHQLSLPFHQALLDSGAGELLAVKSESAEFRYDFRKEDTTELSLVTQFPDGRVLRTQLSRDEHPDLYAMRDRLGELQALARERRIAAALQQAEPPK